MCFHTLNCRIRHLTLSLTQRRMLFCIIGSSGVGKDTMVNRAVAEHMGRIHKVAGYTTRALRSTECKSDINSISTDEFNGMLARGEFVEHVAVHGNKYGMTLASVQPVPCVTKMAIVTLHAVAQFRSAGIRVCPILLRVSDKDADATLRRRLELRGDAAGAIDMRMETARREVNEYAENVHQFAHTIICDDRDDAYEQLMHIMAEPIEADVVLEEAQTM